MAADEPSSTKNRVYIHPRSATFQSHPVATSACRIPVPAGHATGLVMPIDCDSGSQNTENP